MKNIEKMPENDLNKVKIEKKILPLNRSVSDYCEILSRRIVN